MDYTYISKNLAEINNRIEAACNRSGRERKEVTLIAVSKMNPAEAIEAAYGYGQTVFGENKVQELMDKQETLSIQPEWHLIGHLQTNKVKYVVGKVEMIQSVDSLKLAEAISKESVKKNTTTNILIEVNIGGEESKFGVTPEECDTLVKEISKLSGVAVKGLMTVAPPVEKAEESRVHFRRMKELFVDIGSKNYDNINMSVLSMGMSSDFEIAIEEGATHVRVGTSIFGARNYQK